MKSMMQACVKPHPLMHTVKGAGLGFLLASFVWTSSTIMLGVILLVVGFVGDFVSRRQETPT